MSESTEKVWDLWQEVFGSARKMYGLKRSVSFPGRNVKKFTGRTRGKVFGRTQKVQEMKQNVSFPGKSVQKYSKSAESETKGSILIQKMCSKLRQEVFETAYTDCDATFCLQPKRNIPFINATEMDREKTK